MRWFIADTHFGHEKIIRLSGRPFSSVEEMDGTMIARWNKTVGEADDVFVLGDFGLAASGYLSDVLHSLNGSKILIRGNHDGSVPRMRRIGFDAVVEEALVCIAGYDVLLSHYPLPFGSNTLRLHGHIHEKGYPYFDRGQLCVCAELWDYAPISEKAVQGHIRKWIRDGNCCERRIDTRRGIIDSGGDSK